VKEQKAEKRKTKVRKHVKKRKEKLQQKKKWINIFCVYLRRYIVNKPPALLKPCKKLICRQLWTQWQMFLTSSVLLFEGRSCIMELIFKSQDGTRFGVFQISVFTTSDFSFFIYRKVHLLPNRNYGGCKWFWVHSFEFFFFICRCIPEKCILSHDWVTRARKHVLSTNITFIIPFLLQFLQARMWDVHSPCAFCIPFNTLR
jgi:hypothetical protein